MAAPSEGERAFAQQLGRMAREQLPQLDWEPHLQLGWKTSAHADKVRWRDVRLYARESWGRANGCEL